MLCTNKQEPQEVLMAGRLRTIDARTLADAVLEPPGYAVKDLLVPHTRFAGQKNNLYNGKG